MVSKRVKQELEKFLMDYKSINVKRTVSSLLEEIASIENVKSIVPDEFEEIYTINIADLFTIKLKLYKEVKRFKLGNFIYITKNNNQLIEYKQLLKA